MTLLSNFCVITMKIPIIEKLANTQLWKLRLVLNCFWFILKISRHSKILKFSRCNSWPETSYVPQQHEHLIMFTKWLRLLALLWFKESGVNLVFQISQPRKNVSKKSNLISLCAIHFYSPEAKIILQRTCIKILWTNATIIVLEPEMEPRNHQNSKQN